MKEPSAADYRPTTDSELTEMELAFRASQLGDVFKGRLPTASELQNITEELGPELAIAILMKVLQDSTVHGELGRRLRALDPQRSADRKPGYASIEVTVVASNLSRSGRVWGDHVDKWRSWARELGFTTEAIETNAKLSVSENARVIREFLSQNRHPCRLLVTYGQGTSEFRYLLARLKRSQRLSSFEAVEGVRGWINVCGSFGGSSASRHLDAVPLRRLTERLRLKLSGRNPLTLAETSSGSSLWKQASPIPAGLVVTSLVGLPHRAQVPLSLKPIYDILIKKFPNDGLVSFSEAAALPGFVYPVLGMSHAANDVKLKPVLQRAMMLMGNSLVAETPVESATEPTGGLELDL